MCPYSAAVAPAPPATLLGTHYFAVCVSGQILCFALDMGMIPQWLCTYSLPGERECVSLAGSSKFLAFTTPSCGQVFTSDLPMLLPQMPKSE
eukprot:m.25168 g.25168  ORF g.25168 m.25168 type:complete len:92 (+) comp4400_c0_seq1:928-1203(+)